MAVGSGNEGGGSEVVVVGVSGEEEGGGGGGGRREESMVGVLGSRDGEEDVVEGDEDGEGLEVEGFLGGVVELEVGDEGRDDEDEGLLDPFDFDDASTSFDSSILRSILSPKSRLNRLL